MRAESSIEPLSRRHLIAIKAYLTSSEAHPLPLSVDTAKAIDR
jgi:hypothetical protein